MYIFRKFDTWNRRVESFLFMLHADAEYELFNLWGIVAKSARHLRFKLNASEWVLLTLELCFCPSIAKTLHATSAYKMQFSLSYDTVYIKFLLIFLLSYQRCQFNLQSNVMISSIRSTFMRHGKSLEFI